MFKETFELWTQSFFKLNYFDDLNIQLSFCVQMIAYNFRLFIEQEPILYSYSFASLIMLEMFDCQFF